MARNTAPKMRAFLSRDDTVSLFGGRDLGSDYYGCCCPGQCCRVICSAAASSAKAIQDRLFESSVLGPSALRFFRLLLGDLIHQAPRATSTSPDRIRIAFPANMSPESKWLSL